MSAHMQPSPRPSAAPLPLRGEGSGCVPLPAAGEGPSRSDRVRAALVLLLTCALLAAPPAQAGDLAEEAQVQFELGAARYRAHDFLGALAHFLASNRLAPNQSVLFNAGRCYEQLGRHPDAYGAYARALELESDPQRKKLLEESVARVSPGVALLDVQTDPPGATLYLERKDLGARGTSPRRIGVGPGKLQVFAELAGHEPAQSEPVEVAVGKVTTVTLKLVPIRGTIVLGDDVAGAVAYLDDDAAPPACTAPCAISATPGAHTLILKRPGWERTELPLDVKPRMSLTPKPKMALLAGSLAVDSDIPDALIEVDGKLAGFAPAVLQVPVGPRSVVVSRNGYKTFRTTVTIEPTTQKRLEVSLTPSGEVEAAARGEQSVQDAPASVSIVPASELRGMQYPTIGEALRGVRGMYVADDRSYLTLGIRGFFRPGDYGNRVLVLVDGHPTNDNYVGSAHVGFDARADLDDVERIEVVRGPGSVLYGTGAFFGVVNLVTRGRGDPSHIEASVSTVENGAGRVRVSGNYRGPGDSGVWLSAAGVHGTGRDFYFPEFDKPGVSSGVARGIDGFQTGTVNGRAWWGDLTLQWMYTQRDKNVPTGEYETVFGSSKTTLRDGQGFAELKYEPKISQTLRSTTRLHVNTYNFLGTYDVTTPDVANSSEHFSGSWAGAEERVVFAPFAALQVTAGGEVIRNFGLQIAGGGDKTAQLLGNMASTFVRSAYVLADVTPLSFLKASGGVRMDIGVSGDPAWSPRIALIGKPWSQGGVKLILGTAFREPSIYERVYAADTVVTQGGLKRESVTSLDFELSQRFLGEWTATLGAFGNQVDNLIRLVPGGTGQLDWTGQPAKTVYDNSDARVATYGVEAELRRDLRNGWMVAAQGSWQRAIYLNNTEGLRQVPGAPDLLLGLRGAMQLVPRLLTATTRLSWIGAMWDRNDEANQPAQGKTEPGLIWDVVMTGDAHQLGVRYAVGLYNAMDWRTTTPVSHEFRQRTMVQDGRTFLLSLSKSF